MILHLPLLRIIAPSNIITLFQITIPIVMFDVLENDYGLDMGLLVEFDEETQEQRLVSLLD